MKHGSLLNSDIFKMQKLEIFDKKKLFHFFMLPITLQGIVFTYEFVIQFGLLNLGKFFSRVLEEKGVHPLSKFYLDIRNRKMMKKMWKKKKIKKKFEAKGKLGLIELRRKKRYHFHQMKDEKIVLDELDKVYTDHFFGGRKKKFCSYSRNASKIFFKLLKKKIEEINMFEVIHMSKGMVNYIGLIDRKKVIQ